MTIALPVDRAVGALYRARQRQVWGATRKALATGDPAACLRRLLGEDPAASRAEEFLEEFRAERGLRDLVERHQALLGKDWQGKLTGPSRSSLVFCYAALRVRRPRVVVETGCASGWLSAVILSALRRNGEGHLYSIDIPPKEGRFQMDWTLPPDLQPGFLVPPELRGRWTLVLGDVRDHLPPLLAKVQEVGAFVHDSEHTYTHMMWEFASAWPRLEPGGLLVSDDIGWNMAFWDFASAVGRRPVVHASNLNFGAIARQPEEHRDR